MGGVHYENRWKWLLQIRSAHNSEKSEDKENTIEVDGEDLAGLTENEILKKHVKSELFQHYSTSESAKKEGVEQTWCTVQSVYEGWIGPADPILICDGLRKDNTGEG